MTNSTPARSLSSSASLTDHGVEAPINNAQIARIHTLLPAHLKVAEAKAEFIHSFTEDQERTSTKDLTYYEAEEIIYFLRTGKQTKYAHYALFDKDNKQHTYILSLAHQKGWTQYDNKNKRMVADLEALGAWMYKYGYLHKALKEYKPSELPKLVTQFQKV